MKLITPAWRSAWYEEGLSERFAQEMTRLEKTTVRDLGTSAQWVEQMVIELGQLTQNMIHLEGELPRPPQVRLAVEKALKLAALAAHLTAALDQALDKGPAVLRYTPDQVAPGSSLAHISSGSTRGAGQADASEPPRTPAHAAAAHAAPSSPGPAFSVTQPTAQHAGQAAPQFAAAHAPESQATHLAEGAPPGLRVSPQVQLGLQRQSAPAPAAAPSAGALLARPAKAPLFSPLMDISQQLIPESASPVREMILALSRRGLTRSEIEVITEQPRHIIEAVLSAG